SCFSSLSAARPRRPGDVLSHDDYLCEWLRRLRRWTRSVEAPGRPRRGLTKYLLTDHCQFDILVFGPGWRGSNAIRSTASARVLHPARRRGGRVAPAAPAAAAARRHRM